LAITALRTIQSTKLLTARPLPAVDLQSLSPFLKPLTESSRSAQTLTTARVIARDPFSATGLARPSTPSATGSGAQPSAPTDVRWVVSSILVDGSKKSAIVNDTWVTVGDTLSGGSRLTAVERDHIVVTDAKGIRHKVPLQGGES